MAYGDDDIAKVRASNNIVEVVSEAVALKRKGHLAWARCPFHKEKTPSFKVDSQTGLYYCFGCREGGDVIRFVEKTKSLTFVEAVEYLAARAGIVPAGSPSFRRDQSGRRRLSDAVSEAADFYHRYLVESPQAQEARAYLEKRGIGREAIARFRLGYSPDSWDSLTRHLREKGFGEGVLIDAGVAVRNDSGRLRDFFRARIMFPICDAAGKPIAFGGRTLPDAPPEAGPKYRNSPNTRLYNKSQALYALHLARREISSSGSVVVVEGYTDVIALHRLGMTNAVATCGTTFGAEHVEVLRRHGLTTAAPLGSLRVVLAFDSDTAGEVAGGRAFDRVLGAGAAEVLDVRVALLPDEKDPADLALEEPDALEDSLRRASPALGYLIERSLVGAQLDSPEAKIGAARVAVRQALRHPDPMVQQQYLQSIAELCGLDPKTVREIWIDAGGTGRSKPPSGGRGRASGGDGVPAVDIDKIRLQLFGSAEAVSELGGYDPTEVIESDAGRRALDALVGARGDVAEALRNLESNDDARQALNRAAAEELELSGEDLKRWEASVLEDARRRVLEKKAGRAKAEGDLETWQRISRELKGVATRG